METNYCCYSILEKIQNTIDLILLQHNNIIIHKQLKTIQQSLIEQKRFIIQMKEECIYDSVYALDDKEYLIELKSHLTTIWGCYKVIEHYTDTKLVKKILWTPLFSKSFETLSKNVISSFNRIRVLPVKPFMVERSVDISIVFEPNPESSTVLV
ncbi:hypothetical protein K502DRAFT_345452 [Neoconidiobolus thromboides FSU 785]|nr:hypothetical protein K502DRAFT_345452 [Neoconidiobolus thromboides FSU 785]